MTPAAQRAAVKAIQDMHGVSERRASALCGCNRNTARHISKRQDDPNLVARLKELAVKHRSWGYRMLCGRLRIEGFAVNHKHVYRLYKELGLAHRPAARKRIKGQKKGHPPVPVTINEVWTMDFVSDNLSNGRSIRTLNIIDAFTRECLAIEVATSISGGRVKRTLAGLLEEHGIPQRIQVDNGPEFRCKEVNEWAAGEGITMYFIDPGKPTQNNRIESFNSRFRIECLNSEWFTSLAEARHTISEWRQHYNEERPHSSLRYKPPAQWAREYRAGQIVPGEIILSSPGQETKGMKNLSNDPPSFGFLQKIIGPEIFSIEMV